MKQKQARMFLRAKKKMSMKNVFSNQFDYQAELIKRVSSSELIETMFPGEQERAEALQDRDAI